MIIDHSTAQKMAKSEIITNNVSFLKKTEQVTNSLLQTTTNEQYLFEWMSEPQQTVLDMFSEEQELEIHLYSKKDQENSHKDPNSPEMQQHKDVYIKKFNGWVGSVKKFSMT